LEASLFNLYIYTRARARGAPVRRDYYHGKMNYDTALHTVENDLELNTLNILQSSSHLCLFPFYLRIITTHLIRSWKSTGVYINTFLNDFITLVRPNMLKHNPQNNPEILYLNWFSDFSQDIKLQING